MDEEASAEFESLLLKEALGKSLEENKSLHASFIDVKILEKLSKILPKYINSADASYTISLLREEVYSGFSIPTSENLHKLISKCVKCKNEIQVSVQEPKWNVTDPDLLIVGVNPSNVEPYFKLLVDSLKAAGFSSTRCGLTYVTRCPVNNSIPTTCLENCYPYLSTEIHALKPKLIMTLGLQAYQIVTGNALATAKESFNTIHWHGIYPFFAQYSLAQVQRAYTEEITNISDSFTSNFRAAYKYLYDD